MENMTCLLMWHVQGTFPSIKRNQQHQVKEGEEKKMCSGRQTGSILRLVGVGYFVLFSGRLHKIFGFW